MNSHVGTLCSIRRFTDCMVSAGLHACRDPQSPRAARARRQPAPAGAAAPDRQLVRRIPPASQPRPSRPPRPCCCGSSSDGLWQSPQFQVGLETGPTLCSMKQGSCLGSCSGNIRAYPRRGISRNEPWCLPRARPRLVSHSSVPMPLLPRASLSAGMVPRTALAGESLARARQAVMADLASNPPARQRPPLDLPVSFVAQAAPQARLPCSPKRGCCVGPAPMTSFFASCERHRSPLLVSHMARLSIAYLPYA